MRVIEFLLPYPLIMKIVFYLSGLNLTSPSQKQWGVCFCFDAVIQKSTRNEKGKSEIGSLIV